jgi:predicted RNase H-related nuclease YkuK (DUF458 family)
MEQGFLGTSTYEFRKHDGTTTGDIAKYIRDYINSMEYGDFELYIGCDSLPPKRHVTTFVVVVVIYRVGKGAHVVHKRFQESIKSYKLNQKDGTYARLWHEVELAVDVAKHLRDSGLLNLNTKMRKLKSLTMDIHIDINPDKTYLSNKVYSAAVGFIKGQGFEWHAKPNAPAASYAADHICRW